MPDALLIGLSGLQSHQRAIEVTSHNIANATTPGYTRQRADLAANSPELNPLGQLGRGVTVEAIKRVANDLIIERIRQSQSEDTRLGKLGETLKAAEAIFNEPGENGLSAAISNLFGSFEDLSNNPESTALRSSVVSQMDTFTATLNDIGGRLQNLRDDLRGSLESEVADVNRLTTQISDLNQQIRDLSVVGNNPNDLMDRRDQLINQLSQHMDLRVRHIPADGSVMIDSGGILLVGRDYAEQLSVGSQPDGSLTLLAANKTGISATGGGIGALLDLHERIIPGLIKDMDTVTSSLALELNARQSTGTNHAFFAGAFTSEQAIDGALTATNLDSTDQIKGPTGTPGLSEAFLPSFTDSNGNAVARNLTINVYDPVSKTAQKYTLRYDPATGGGARSLDDLISAINTGRSTGSGSFTLYPSDAGGITDVTARKVPIDGGYRLELSAANGKSIDFSAALDLAPTTNAWTSGATTVTGTDATLANKRVVFTVVGNTLQASVRSAVDGSAQAYGSSLVLGGAASAIGSLGLTLTPVATNYHNGDSFSVDFDSTGAVVGGSQTQATEWTQGDASLKITGRYTGAVTFTPNQQWSMRVVTSGNIGSATAAPLVEFSYFSGPADAPVQQRVQRVLDNTLPAGSPVEIADGVYAVFGSGALSTPGNQVSFTVDAEPDQARLLPALGINTMFSGDTAATLNVSAALKKDANRLGLASSRSEGDNSNLSDMSEVRKGKIFGGGSLAVDDYYHTTITNLGVQVADTTRLQDNQQALGTALENQRQQSSGVSIDEEVANLILMQQAYTASARIITTARENITTLLDLLR
jgi:flagellar hook-associated protein FlgK